MIMKMIMKMNLRKMIIIIMKKKTNKIIINYLKITKTKNYHYLCNNNKNNKIRYQHTSFSKNNQPKERKTC